MNASFSIQLRNGATSRDKWGALVGDFKKIYDYQTCLGNNQDYWSLNLNEKLAWGLPRNFGQVQYEMIGEFLGTQLILNPPHMWDLMDDVDNTYKQSSLTPNDAINLNEAIDLNEDPMDATKVM